MKFLSLFATFALVLVTACGGGTSAPVSGTDGAGAGSGAQAPTLRISVTDAPFPSGFVEEASVVINEVRVRDQDSDTWSTVFTGSATIDLVPLTGGVSALLVEADIEPGSYDEVRLIVDAGRVLLSDTAFTATGDPEFTVANDTLKFPSGAQTGIKVKIDSPIVVTSGLSADLMLDFDLTKSFVFNGPPSHAPGVRRVLFKPVVRASNTTTGGSLRLEAISDSATPADASDDLILAGATVRVCDAADAEVATVLADDLGVAVVSLAPGTYTIKVEAAAHATSSVTDVAITLANLTDLGMLTLAVSEAEIIGSVHTDGATAADTTDDPVLVGATVEVRAAGDAVLVDSATTDDQGSFAFAMLAPGSYDVRVIAAGHLTLDVSAVDAAGPGLFTPLALVLVAHTRDVKGNVVDNAAAALVGATVEIHDVEGTSLGSTTTDSNGDYVLLGIATGNQTITVTPSGTTTGHVEALVVVGTDPVSDQTADIALP